MDLRENISNNKANSLPNNVSQYKIINFSMNEVISYFFQFYCLRKHEKNN